MSGFITIGSRMVVVLSGAELIMGFLKSLRIHSKYSIWVFLVFGICELLLGVIIAASIISQISTLHYLSSQVLYALAVSFDFLFLFADLWAAGGYIWKERASPDLRIQWNGANIMEFIKYVSFLIVPASIPFVVLIFTLIGFDYSVMDISVSELSNSAAITTSIRTCFVGYISLFFSLILSLVILGLVFSYNGSRSKIIIIACFMFTTELALISIVSAAFGETREIVRGYTFISVTTLAPVVSYQWSIFKILIIEKLSSARRNENRPRRNEEQ